MIQKVSKNTGIYKNDVVFYCYRTYVRFTLFVTKHIRNFKAIKKERIYFLSFFSFFSPISRNKYNSLTNGSNMMASITRIALHTLLIFFIVFSVLVCFFRSGGNGGISYLVRLFIPFYRLFCFSYSYFFFFYRAIL